MRQLKVDVVMLGASGRDFVCGVMGHFQPQKGVDGVDDTLGCFDSDVSAEEIVDADRSDMILLVADLKDDEELDPSFIADIGEAARERNVPVGAFVIATSTFDSAKIEQSVDFCDVTKINDSTQDTSEVFAGLYNKRVRSFLELFRNDDSTPVDVRKVLAEVRKKANF